MLQKPWVPYVAPFAVFMLFTALAPLWPDGRPLLYITKTLVVGALLWHWRAAYRLDIAAPLGAKGCAVAVAAGLLVLAAWVLPEELLPQLGEPAGFNPYGFGWPPAATIGLIAVRLTGAAVVVPVMEELFWRSFILRYAVNPDFRSVPLGTFTWFSFAVVVVLFALEHHRVVPGLFAGIVYTGLVVAQKNLRGPILAHAVTNLGLGVYVLATAGWHFW